VQQNAPVLYLMDIAGYIEVEINVDAIRGIAISPRT
jgi:hypothetical protein